MGSAFTPVKTRTSSPMPSGGSSSSGPFGGASLGLHLKSSGHSRPHKRSLLRQKMSTLAEVDEDHLMTSDAATVSTAASDGAASEASRGSQPPLLDFIGNACEASSWFTSCFPCAVVDINDGDDYVVNKLSREAAMHVMYASPEPPPGGARPAGASSPAGSEAYSDIFQLPRAEETAQSAPHAMVEEDEEMLDTISLDDDANNPGAGPAGRQASKGPVNELKSPPKNSKKKFSMKMFGRKNKS